MDIRNVRNTTWLMTSISVATVTNIEVSMNFHGQVLEEFQIVFDTTRIELESLGFTR